METISLFLVALSTFTVTSYRSVPGQTDATPYVTSIGEKVGSYGIAISEELLCPDIRHSSKDAIKKHTAKNCKHKDFLHYGDVLYIEGVGFKTINDVMGSTHLVKTKHTQIVLVNGKKVKRIVTVSKRVKQAQAIDVWVATYAEEHAFQVRNLKVWLVRDTDPKVAESTGPLKNCKTSEMQPRSDSHWWSMVSKENL